MFDFVACARATLAQNARVVVDRDDFRGWIHASFACELAWRVTQLDRVRHKSMDEFFQLVRFVSLGRVDQAFAILLAHVFRCEQFDDHSDGILEDLDRLWALGACQRGDDHPIFDMVSARRDQVFFDPSTFALFLDLDHANSANPDGLKVLTMAQYRHGIDVLDASHIHSSHRIIDRRRPWNDLTSIVDQHNSLGVAQWNCFLDHHRLAVDGDANIQFQIGQRCICSTD